MLWNVINVTTHISVHFQTANVEDRKKNFLYRATLMNCHTANVCCERHFEIAHFAWHLHSPTLASVLSVK